MPLDHDQLNIERDPETHDAEAIQPGATEADVAAVRAALKTFTAPSGPLLDIGCGTGRHLRALAASGHAVVGLD
jgi:cyclopropane fatty-acyl-phospholipid synthase-like methyltransferase